MTQDSQPTPKPSIVKEARQRQLIDATISTIGRVGYSGTTLNHVAGAAGLSPGIVNFYFKSKDQLLAATLAQLAEEHESLWLAKIAAAGGDFDPSICTADKVVVWFAFWAEAQSRPLYRSVVSELEERYFQQTHAFCAELVEKGGYVGIDPADVARGLNAISDGLWADLLILPETFDLPAAKRICRTFLGAVFPRHFPRTSGPANDPAPAGRAPGASIGAGPGPQSTAHRARLSAALQRRLFPASTLQPTELARQLGVELPMLLDWIDGRDEPSSSQLGRLVATLDPVFLLDLYGDEVDSMRQRFEAALAEAREAEARARAALDILRGNAR
jgi:TetR/AcrR family transcriptional repressor of bet genes